MTLRTIDQFEALLTEDLKWRVNELDAWFGVVKDAREHQLPGLLRGGVALLYSHWEGYVKEATRAYLEYVSSKRLKLGELCPELAAIAMRGVLGKGEQSKLSADHTAIITLLRSESTTLAQLKYDRATIRTNSNLNFERFEDIMHSVGCDASRHEIHRALINNRLLKQRNSVAHGAYEVIDRTDWEVMRDRVIEILRDVRTQLQNAAATKAYLAQP